MTLVPQGQSPTVPWAHPLLSGWVTMALSSWLLLTRCLSLIQLAACSLARLMLLQGVQPWPTLGCDGWMDRWTDIQPWQGSQLPVSCLARLVGLCSHVCVLCCHATFDVLALGHRCPFIEALTSAFALVGGDGEGWQAGAGWGPDVAPKAGDAWIPLLRSQAFPDKLESPHPKAYRVPSTGLASASGKHIREGSVLPLAPGTRVSTWQRLLALCLFYVFIFTSIYL